MSDPRSPLSYDAFGDRTATSMPLSKSPAARRARAAAIAIFWSLALVIVVGRVHFAPTLIPAAFDLASR